MRRVNVCSECSELRTVGASSFSSLAILKGQLCRQTTPRSSIVQVQYQGDRYIQSSSHIPSVRHVICSRTPYQALASSGSSKPLPVTYHTSLARNYLSIVSRSALCCRLWTSSCNVLLSCCTSATTSLAAWSSLVCSIWGCGWAWVVRLGSMVTVAASQ